MDRATGREVLKILGKLLDEVKADKAEAEGSRREHLTGQVYGIGRAIQKLNDCGIYDLAEGW